VKEKETTVKKKGIISSKRGVLLKGKRKKRSRQKTKKGEVIGKSIHAIGKSRFLLIGGTPQGRFLLKTERGWRILPLMKGKRKRNSFP